MAKHVYIDCTEFGQSVLSREIRSKLPNLEIHTGDPDPDTLDRLLQGAVGVINGHTLMNAELLSRYPELRSIVFLGTGAASYIDTTAAEQAGIKVRGVRGYGDRTIAEHAFALMLASARQIALMDRNVRGGSWYEPVGMELVGKQLGVIGTGGVGSSLVRMASGFGMDVAAWNRSGVAADLPCKEMSLDELIASSHVISLHVALNESTRHLLDRTHLERMRSDAILVNVSRGGVVDETALIEHLQAGRIAHAALDVFDQEPLPGDHPLTHLENVTLTCHAAFKSREAMERLLSGGFDLLRKDLG